MSIDAIPEGDDATLTSQARPPARRSATERESVVQAPESKAADSDVLGEAVSMPAPDATGQVPVGPSDPKAPEPPPTEDENQPGFIGERNRPRP